MKSKFQLQQVNLNDLLVKGMLDKFPFEVSKPLKRCGWNEWTKVIEKNNFDFDMFYPNWNVLSMCNTTLDMIIIANTIIQLNQCMLFF
jgi:hypothetical protein